MTPDDVYRHLGMRVGKNRIYELLRSDQLPARKIGNRYYISRAGLEEWIRHGLGREDKSE